MNPRSVTSRVLFLRAERADELRAELSGELVLPGDPE